MAKRPGIFVTDADRQQAAWQGLLGMGTQLMAGSAPSLRPGGFQRGLAQGGQTFVNTYNQGVNNAQRMGMNDIQAKLGQNELATSEAGLQNTQRLYAYGDEQFNKTGDPAWKIDPSGMLAHERAMQKYKMQRGLKLSDKIDELTMADDLARGRLRDKPYLDLGMEPPSSAPTGPAQPPMAQGAPMQPQAPTGQPGSPKSLMELQAEAEGVRVRASEAAKVSVKKQAAFPKAANALKDFEMKSSTVRNAIDEALNIAAPVNEKTGQREANAYATGWGSYLSAMPNSEAGALDGYLTTIKANVGFDTLQKMRDNSPTGGALGQVSEMENKLLQAVNGALDPKQSAQLVKNLEIIKEMYPKVLAQKQEAFAYDYGDMIGEQASAGLPEGVTEEDIQHTMKVHSLSREAVLSRLGGGQ